MRLLLIRHGTTDEVGRVLTGWTPGVHLNAEGRGQAEAAAERLARVPVRAIYTSPVDRARETAGTIAARLGLVAVVSEALGELRLGRWTGRSLESLEGDPEWDRFNSFRPGTRPPGGEWMIEVQARVVAEIQRLRELHPDDVVAAVTHGDPIKAALFHYGGIALDMMLRWDIAPASVTVVDLHPWGATVLAVNDTGRPPW
jgi:probable phosphomutase (TIGR03848 family)